MFASQEEKREEFVKLLAKRWINKFRLAKLKRMEMVRNEMERIQDASIATTGGSGHASFKFTLQSTGSDAGGKVNAIQEKLKYTLVKQKQKDKAERRKLVKKQQRLQAELEYLNFPTIMGWYFDGFFTRPFFLNEEYAAMFNVLEEGVARKKELSFKETFTEKTRRNFWPPDFLGSSFFRTRGVYMDILETRKDPPHTPPQIDFEKESHTYSTFLAPVEKTETKLKFVSDEEESDGFREPCFGAEDEEDEDVPQIVRVKKRKGKYDPLSTKWYRKVQKEERIKAIKKTDFYFDDVKAEFFRKTRADENNYYYDLKYDVWRIKRSPLIFASDFYFDMMSTNFQFKDRNRKESDYVYDSNFACYKLAEQEGKGPKGGLGPADFIFDEKMSRWRKYAPLPQVEKSAVIDDHNGLRRAIKNGNPTPDDFFFDTQEGAFLRKTGADTDHTKYTFDTTQGVWKLTFIPPEVNLSKKTPTYYFWDEKLFEFKRKNAPATFFIYDSNNKIYRLKKSLVGKYCPKNWRWNNERKLWELQRNRKGYYEEELHWRPDRDYDKPWLEYVGGQKPLARKDSFEDTEKTEIDHMYIPTTTTNIERRQTLPGPTKAKATVVNPKDNLASDKTKAKEGGGGGTTTAAPAPTPTEPSVKWKAKESHDQEDEEEHKPLTEAEKTLAIYDKYDHRVLKVSGLGFVLNEGDMKAFFVNAIRVLRPRVINSDTHEDFCLVYFHTDEAATAALKTMHHKKIKGMTLSISYCKKADRVIFEHRNEEHIIQARERKKSEFVG